MDFLARSIFGFQRFWVDIENVALDCVRSGQNDLTVAKGQTGDIFNVTEAPRFHVLFSARPHSGQGGASDPS